MACEVSHVGKLAYHAVAENAAEVPKSFAKLWRFSRGFWTCRELKSFLVTTTVTTKSLKALALPTTVTTAFFFGNPGT